MYNNNIIEIRTILLCYCINYKWVHWIVCRWWTLGGRCWLWASSRCTARSRKPSPTTGQQWAHRRWVLALDLGACPPSAWNDLLRLTAMRTVHCFQSLARGPFCRPGATLDVWDWCKRIKMEAEAEYAVLGFGYALSFVCYERFILCACVSIEYGYTAACDTWCMWILEAAQPEPTRRLVLQKTYSIGIL